MSVEKHFQALPSECKADFAFFNQFSRIFMIYSMTGYAAKTIALDCGVLNIELKSVNFRYLDFQFRICEELRAARSNAASVFRHAPYGKRRNR